MRRNYLPLTALILAHGVSAAEFGGYVALMTDYVKRGVTQSDGNPALQLGGAVGFANGVFLGAWGSTTDINNGVGRQRDREVNYFLGYAVDVTESWRLSAHAVAYEYPGESITTTVNTRSALIMMTDSGSSFPIRRISTTPDCPRPTSIYSPNGHLLASGQ